MRISSQVPQVALFLSSSRYVREAVPGGTGNGRWSGSNAGHSSFATR